MKYYLYNPLANNGIRLDVPGAELLDATKTDYPSFFADLAAEDEVIVTWSAELYEGAAIQIAGAAAGEEASQDANQ